MRQTIATILAIAIVACVSHVPEPGHRSTSDERGTSNVVSSDATIATARPGPVRPITFASACVPHVLRLPVRADIEPGQTPDPDYAGVGRASDTSLVFLRPLCIKDHGETRCRDRPDAVIAAQGTSGFHGEGVGVLSVIYSTQLSVRLERFDETASMSDAFAFTEADSVVEDGCLTIRWSADGVGTLANVRGDFTRADAGSPWMFRPGPRLCAQTHVAGDDRVFDAPLRVTGKGTTAIPKTGLSGVYVTGTIRASDAPSSTPFVQGAFSVVADQVVRLEYRGPW
jgi:hypothetical protein